MQSDAGLLGRCAHDVLIGAVGALPVGELEIFAPPAQARLRRPAAAFHSVHESIRAVSRSKTTASYRRSVKRRSFVRAARPEYRRRAPCHRDPGRAQHDRRARHLAPGQRLAEQDRAEDQRDHRRHERIEPGARRAPIVQQPQEDRLGNERSADHEEQKSRERRRRQQRAERIERHRLEHERQHAQSHRRHDRLRGREFERLHVLQAAAATARSRGNRRARPPRPPLRPTVRAACRRSSPCSRTAEASPRCRARARRSAARSAAPVRTGSRGRRRTPGSSTG